MVERDAAITSRGNPLTLLGPELKVSDMAPSFCAVDRQMQMVGLEDLGGGVKLISAVPSLDTEVCELQTRHFYREVALLDGVTLVTISMDLPFAQARFCSTYGLDAITLSDYMQRSFGMAYGVLIKELQLLARSVFVIDADNNIRYVQIVDEVSDEVDFEAALGAARDAVA